MAKRKKKQAPLSTREIKETIDQERERTKPRRATMSKFLKRFKNDFWKQSRRDDEDGILPDDGNWSSGVTVNWCFANIAQLAPLLTDNRPVWAVRGRSRAEQPYLNLWNEALEWLWDVLNMSHRYLEIAYYALIMGMAVVRVSWNPDARGGGMIDLQVLDPRDFVFPHGYRRIDDCPWMGEVRQYPVSWVRENFPETGSEVVGETTDANMRADDMTAWGMNNEMVTVYSIWMKDPTVESVIAEEARKDGDGHTGRDETRINKPMYPNGRFVTIAAQSNERGGPILLEDVPSPYEHGRSPYVLFYDYLVPGEIYGQGELDQVLNLVEEFNAQVRDIAYQLRTHTRRNYDFDPDVIDQTTLENNWAKGGYFFSRKTQLDKERMRPILPIDVPELSEQQFRYLDQQKAWIEEISGINEISKGIINKKAEQSATEFETLAESTHTRTRQRVRNFESATAEILELMMGIAMQFMHQRQIHVARDRVLEFTTIRNSNEFARQALEAFHTGAKARAIEGEAPPEEMQSLDQSQQADLDDFQALFPVAESPALAMFQIVIQSNSMLPMDRQARANMAMRLYQAQGGTDGQSAIDRKALLDVLQWPEADAIIQRFQQKLQEEQQAQQGQGGPPAGPPVQ